MSDQPSETMKIVLNPLSFPEAERALKVTDRPVQAPDVYAVLRYLCEHVNSDPANLTRRYREITKQAPEIFVVPAQQEIVEKILMPRHGAIACDMTGNYYGTIALCGLVCEMLAILIFEIHDVRIRSQPLDSNRQEQLLGRTFEKLGQERRIGVLLAFGIIGEDRGATFNEVRAIRNRHLHLLSHDAASIAADAKRCFQCSAELLGMVFRNEYKDGLLVLNSAILKFLRKAWCGRVSA